MNPDQPNVVYPAGGAPEPVPTAPAAAPEPPKEKRSINLPLILAVLMLVVAIVMGIVAINYINKFNKTQATIDQQKAQAAQAARDEQKVVDEKDFAERDKQPFRTYQAPAVLGAIQAEFPKNWNVYAVEEEKSQIQLDVFMYPGVVRAEKSTTEPYSFRIKMERKLYPEALQPYQKKVEKGQLTAQAAAVSGITGTRFDGQITDNRTGSIILLPVRDKTLFIWTESPNYAADYNTIIAKMAISP